MRTLVSALRPGDRVECLEMPGDPDPVKRGTRGTIVNAQTSDGVSIIYVAWDGGRCLNLTVPPDSFKVVQDTHIRIHKDSHMDHSVTEDQRRYALAQASRHLPAKGILVMSIELPPALGTVLCGLHGPIMGDPAVSDRDVTYTTRGDRGGASRMVQRAPRKVPVVTVVAGPHDGHPWVLFTIYGGPSAPREPWDKSLNDGQRAESIAFWEEHALSVEKAK